MVHDFIIRDAAEGDVESIQAIYAPHVLHGLATFEEVPPGVEEMRARFRALAAEKRPYLVAVRSGEVVGYAYAGAYRPRPAYRFTVENSIYLRDDAARQGIGTALLETLIAACERGPWRQMLAVIGNSANAGSIAVHRRLGFELVGVMKNVGFKHGRWVDTVIMQRSLGAGASLPPK